jgi:hypothetical protein
MNQGRAYVSLLCSFDIYYAGTFSLTLHSQTLPATAFLPSKDHVSRRVKTMRMEPLVR